MSETTETARPCAWCGKPVRQHGIGRTKEYCGRTCRELAYRARKQERLIGEAVARAVAAAPPSDSSVVETARSDSSVVETGRGRETTVPGVVPEAWKAPARVERRRLSRNRSHMTADPFPRLPPEQPGPEFGEG